MIVAETPLFVLLIVACTPLFVLLIVADTPFVVLLTVVVESKTSPPQSTHSIAHDSCGLFD